MACFQFFQSILTLVRNLCAIVTYSLDLALDIALGVRYYTDYWGLDAPLEWAIVTWAIALIPGLVNSVANLCFLCKINHGADMPKWTAYLGYFMSILLMGPPWHNVVTMVKTCQGEVYSAEEAEKLGAIQRSTQAFLQSLPQLYFQIYIVSTINTVTPMQGIVMLTSFVSFTNASFLVIRSLNRKFHFGTSDLTVTTVGTVWIALLLLSGVPSIALFSSLDKFGPAYSGLLVIIFVYLLILPLVIHTKTVCLKIVSAFCQLFYSFTMATTSFLWFFNKMETPHGTDTCAGIPLGGDGTSVEPFSTDSTPSVTTNDTSTTTTNSSSTSFYNTTFTTPTISETTLNYTRVNFTETLDLNSSRVNREVDSNLYLGPLLHLDKIHCLSDWSLVIIIVVTSANAIFFFYHMVLILAVRLRQQVEIHTVASTQTSGSRINTPKTLRRTI